MRSRPARHDVEAVVAVVLAVLLALLAPIAATRAALVATGVPDTATVRHDQTLVWGPPGVLGNDLNLLGGSTAILVSGVSHGALDLRSNGGFSYTPDSGYLGTDSFRYRPSGLLSTAAKVTITVTNAAPVARADAYTWPAGTTLVVAAPGVLANDTDADGDELIAELDGGGISGSFDLDESGGFRFTPGGGFSGSGTVRYRVWDGVAWSPTTSITLTTQSPTPPPTPKPTPTPTPTPRPTLPPLPIPLPSVPLPPLPLPPLPSIGLPPDPDPEPTGPPTSSAPRATPEPSTSDDQPPSRSPASESPSPSPDSDEAAPAAPPTGGSGDGGAGGGAAAPVENAAPRVAFDEPQLDLGAAEIDLLAGIEIWSVPAATLSVPGILLIVWVALQAIGALAWIPAVKRLRGHEDAPAR